MIDLVDTDHVPKKEKLWTRIKYKYWEIWPCCLRPSEMWYNLKCWTWHRYGTIRCRHLPHTWSDRRTLLLYASFQILTDFIDKECSPGHVQWYGEGTHLVMVNGEWENVMDEMMELYRWWNRFYLKEYPQMMDELWDAVDGPKMLCVPYTDMPDHVAGKLEMVYKDDEHKAAYEARSNEINETERLTEKKVEEMLKRLAAVRLWMWT